MMMGIGGISFRLENEKHDGTCHNQGASQPGPYRHYLIPEKPAKKGMKQDFTVHEEGYDHGIHVLESPGHKHLGRKGKEPEACRPEPFHTCRQCKCFFLHHGDPYDEAENLEIKDNFRIRFESFLCQMADDDIGSRREKAASYPIKGMQIERGKVPDLHHHKGAQGDSQKAGYGFLRQFVMKENRRQDAHEESRQLGKDLGIPQRQPFDGYEIKEEGNTPEKSPERKHETVLSRVEFLPALPGEDGNEKYAEKPAEESHFSRRHRLQKPCAAAHESERKGRRQGADDAQGNAASLSFL